MIASCVIGIIKPLRCLEERGKISLEIVLEHKADSAIVSWADVVVFCRNTEPIYASFLDQALSQGKPIIFDLDDNFWDIPFEHDAELASYHRLPVRLQQLEKYLKHADLIRVYSPVMKDLVGAFNKNVHLVKAGVDFSMPPPPSTPKRNDGVIHAVYATSRIVDTQYQLFLPALRKAMDRFPDAFDLTIWGCQPTEFVDYPQVKTWPLVGDYESFFREFAHAKFDIGLAPLENTQFNLCKTNTKYRDYGACRIAGIYSNMDVYSS